MKLDRDNFVRVFHDYLYIEEAYHLRSYAAPALNSTLVIFANCEDEDYRLFSLIVPEKVSLREGDSIFLESKKDSSQIFECVICEIVGRYVTFFCDSSTGTFLVDMNPFKIKIKPNISRIGFRWLHRGVDGFLKNPVTKDIIFPEETSDLASIKISTNQELECISGDMLNQQQLTAVQNILCARCRPAPYIVFGPPGTGKTKTIVEAILQIYGNSESRILVCGSSNYCANLLTSKIKKFVQNEDLVRLVSISHSWRIHSWRIPKEIEGVTVINRSQEFPYRCRIVVTTCAISGELAYFFGLKFDYVIIDEAGQTSEPETLIPIDLCHSDGLVVLAGDPYQLEPYYEAKLLKDSHFATSLLERLNQTVEMYKRRESFDELGSHYNEIYITKLIKSYRCDPRILAVNNKLFYDDDLECLNKSDANVMRALGVKHPIILHKVKGKEERCYNQYWWNPEELFICLYYLKRLYRCGLEPEEIGIITPYSLQKSKFLKWFELFNIPPCKVDTVEAFQGQEREAMIISTVRSFNRLSIRDSLLSRMRFLFQAKRFNVTTSRAKWINLVVGDCDLLEMDKCWSEYLKNAEVVTKEEQNSLQEDSFVTMMSEFYKHMRVFL